MEIKYPLYIPSITLSDFFFFFLSHEIQMTIEQDIVTTMGIQVMQEKKLLNLERPEYGRKHSFQSNNHKNHKGKGEEGRYRSKAQEISLPLRDHYRNSSRRLW